MSHQRVAARYLRANAPLPPNFKLSPRAVKTMENFVGRMEHFASLSLGSYGHSLDSLAWFVKNAVTLQDLIREVVSAFNHVEAILEAEQKSPDGQKHSKELKASFETVRKLYLNPARLNIAHIPKEDIAMLGNLKDIHVQRGEINYFKKNFIFPVKACFTSAVDVLQKTLIILHNVIPELQELADKITTENAMIASEEIQGGGFFKKLFRRANLTLESRLTQPLIDLKNEIHATGVERMNPKSIDDALIVYSKLAIFEDNYISMFKYAMIENYVMPEDKPFMDYLASTLGSFQHYNMHNHSMPLEYIASDTTILHVVQLQAQKFFKVWAEVSK
jgi:hypothetical protein